MERPRHPSSVVPKAMGWALPAFPPLGFDHSPSSQDLLEALAVHGPGQDPSYSVRMEGRSIPAYSEKSCFLAEFSSRETISIRLAGEWHRPGTGISVLLRMLPTFPRYSGAEDSWHEYGIGKGSFPENSVLSDTGRMRDSAQRPKPSITLN